MSDNKKFHKELDKQVMRKIEEMRCKNPICFDNIIVINMLRYISCTIESEKEVITQCCKNDGNSRAVELFFNCIKRHPKFAFEFLKGLVGTGHSDIAEDIMSDINIDMTALLDIETSEFITGLKYAQPAPDSANPPPYDMKSVVISDQEKKTNMYSTSNQVNSQSENSASSLPYDAIIADQEKELQRCSTFGPVSQQPKNNVSPDNNSLNIHPSSSDNNLLDTDVTVTANSRNYLTDKHMIPGSSGDSKLLDTEVTDETVTSDSRNCLTDEHTVPGSSSDSKLLDTEVTDVSVTSDSRNCHTDEQMNPGSSGDGKLLDTEVTELTKNSKDCSTNEHPFNFSNSDTVCTPSVMHESELSMSVSDGEEFKDTLPKVPFATDDNQLSQISKKGSDFTESQECETILEKNQLFNAADNKTASTEKNVANTSASFSEKPQAVAGSLENVTQEGWSFAVVSIAVLFLFMKWHLKLGDSKM